MNEAAVFLTYILNGLVDGHESLSVTPSRDDRGVLLTVRVDRPLMGRIIGKSGKMIGAIRHIMHGFSVNIGANVSILIEEPEL